MARNKNIRFMNNQFASIVNTTFSSEQATFPSSNVLNDRRSKLWSPNGSFIIDDGNKRIYIDGSPGTITKGTYTGSTLAAELETQFNAISSGWTVAYNSTNCRFELTNAGSRTLNFTTTTDAVWDDIGFLTNSNVSTPGTVSSDEPRVHTEEFIKVDLGVALEPTFVGLVGPIDEAFSLSNEATVTIQANNVDEFDSPQLSIVATKTAGGILEFIDSDTEDRIFRFWKIKIEDRKNTQSSTDGFKFGYFYLGDYKTFTTTNVTRGFSKEIQDPSIRFTSESGQDFFQEKIKYYTYNSASIEVMKGQEREEMEQMFYDFGITQSFFVAIDPLNGISLSNDENTKLVRFETKPTFTHVFLDYYNFAFSLKEVI